MSTKKFFWTESLDLMVKRAYQTARNRKELIRNITLLKQTTAFPGFAIHQRAAQLGVARTKPPGWTGEEIERLHELVATAGRRTIARRLGRTEYSVKAQLRKLGLSLQFRDGYTGETLASVLGTSPKTVRRWEQMRWLKKVDDRFPESAIRRFLVTHPEQYQLGRVNEAWFKGMLFDRYNDADTHLEGMRLPPMSETAEIRI